MPSEIYNQEIPLLEIQTSVPNTQSLNDKRTSGDLQTVSTQHGPITISVSGKLNKPIILTYHDLGLNHVSNFQTFMLYPGLKKLLESFCVVHVNAPGQENDARSLPEGYVYPTMDELAETIGCVKNHLELKSFVGFGVGLGANVLARYAIKYPDEVDALILVNGISTVAGWIEWGFQKLNIWHIYSGNMTTRAVDYLMWHHFGNIYECNHDLVVTFKNYFEKSNASNLSLLIESYINRTDLGIVRELNMNRKKYVRMIRCPVLNITGQYSPHVEDTVTLNGRLDPINCTWMKIQDCGLVIDEQPGKVAEALKLLLQGMGYAPNS